MPLPSLPPSPTPDQVAKYVTDAATDVIQTVTTAATTAQNSVETTASEGVKNVNETVTAVNTAVQTAFTDLRTNADRAKNEMQSAADRAVADFRRLVNDVLKLIPHVPTPEDLAIGDVNGAPFYEPLTCFVLLMKAVQDEKNPIKVRLREPTVAQAFRDFEASARDEIVRKAREKFMARMPQVPPPATSGLNRVVDPGSGTLATILASVPPVVWIILAIAALILAVAVSIFVVLMAVAIIYALYKNYNINLIKVGYDTVFGDLRLEIEMTR